MARIIAFFLFLLLPVMSSAEGSKKLALVIGNQGYVGEVGGRLKNPQRDVAIVKEALKKAGFDVRDVVEVTRSTLLREVNEFSIRLGALGPGAIGFFYYSGHGVSRPQFGTNYLIPTDVKSTSDVDFWWNAVALDTIISELKVNAPNASSFVVIDACRTQLITPSKSASKGFANIADENGMFIAFSTSPNASASDEGENGGPYSNALAQELSQVGQNHLTLFQNVKRRVFTRTAGAQRPWESNGLIDWVVLNPPTSVAAAGVVAANDAPQQPRTNQADAQPAPSPDQKDKGAVPNLVGAPNTFCSDLKILADLSSQGFEAIRLGAPKDDTWRSGFALPGFESCQIHKSDNISYSCHTSPSADKAKLIGQSKAFAKQASQCLGWPQSELNGLGQAIALNDRIRDRSIIYSIFDYPEFGEKSKQKRYYASVQIYSQESAVKAAEAVPLAAPPTKPSGYCEDLRKVVNNGPSGFRSLIGRKLFEGTYMSKIQLNGWESCDISEFDNNRNRKWFSCENSATQSAGAADAFVVSVGKDLQDCLGQSWFPKRTASDGRTNLEYISAELPITVELRSRKQGSGYNVKLDVNMSR